MAAPSTDTLTNDDIAAAIKSLLVAATASASSNVWARRVQLLEDGADASHFVELAPPNTRSARVNTLFFWRSGIQPPPAAFSPLTGRNPVPFDPRRVETVKGLRRETWTYTLKLYFGFHDGNEAANSTKDFNALLDAINAGFWAAPKLGLNSYRIDRHSGIIWELTEIFAGKSGVHIGTGQLSVLTHAPSA